MFFCIFKSVMTIFYFFNFLINKVLSNPGRSAVAKDAPPPSPSFPTPIPVGTLKKRTLSQYTECACRVRMPAGSFLIADLFGNTGVKYRQKDETLAPTMIDSQTTNTFTSPTYWAMGIFTQSHDSLTEKATKKTVHLHK